MYTIANCVVDVLRGTTVDDWGDAADNGTPAATGVPALIVVRNVRVWDTTTQTPRMAQTITGAVGSDQDVRTNDQLRVSTAEALMGPKPGTVYAVVSAYQEYGVGRTPDLTLELALLT